jgi:P-type E1-E2 ATPase
MNKEKQNPIKIKGLICNSLNLHEELGMIEHIFADKTGTLTTEELVFKSLSIANSGHLTKIGYGALKVECEIDKI